MPDYDFSVLSSYDFEGLVRDLLQKELRVTLESFGEGVDGGVDLRCSRNPKKTLVVQCKRCVKTPYRKLFGILKNEEMPKVRKIQPKSYIFATALSLTPNQKKQIVRLFHPFIKNPRLS